MMKWYSKLEKPLSQEEQNEFTIHPIKDITYLTSLGLSLALSANILKYISIFPDYTGLLPFGLDFNEKNTNIVRRLGEPDKKISSRSLGIEITYLRLGLSIEFMNFDWEDLENPIKSLILFMGQAQDPFAYGKGCKICSFCCREACKRCGQCKMFFYCSRECQVEHWNVHKEQCRKFKH